MPTRIIKTMEAGGGELHALTENNNLLKKRHAQNAVDSENAGQPHTEHTQF